VFEVARKKFTEVERGIMLIVSKNLKRLIHNKGFSQKDLCDLTSLSTSTISDYVNAKTLISPGNLHIIAEALKVPKSDIYPTNQNDHESFIHNKNSNSKEKELGVLELDIDAWNKDRVVTYKGKELTEEQKKMYAKLVQALFEE
jgi:transcriptional regulator with XRE-family HTH domain